jgi:hypothetical protein
MSWIPGDPRQRMALGFAYLLGDVLRCRSVSPTVTSATDDRKVALEAFCEKFLRESQIARRIPTNEESIPCSTADLK